MRITTLIVLIFAISSLGQATDWPHFRGPQQDGAAQASGLLAGKTFGFEVSWKRDLGSGYSCISVAGKTGVTMYTDGEKDLVTAFNIDSGEEIWHYELGPVYKGHTGSHDGPSGTPTIHENSVYALDTHGVLVALSLDEGKLQWRHHLGEDIEARVPHYGFNTVPMVFGDALVVMTGKKEGRAFTALNRKTGEEMWHGGNDTTTYQTPFIGEYKGQKRLMGVTDNFLMELNPATGEVLWQQEHKTLDNESYALPLFVGDDRVMILNRRGVAAFDMTWENGKATMTESWRNNVFMRTYAIPVIHNGYVFGFKSNFLACINPADGSVMWRSRPPGGKALTLLDGHLIIISDDGDLVAVEATHEAYREKARIKLFDQDSYTAASYADGVLFLRNRKEMARVRITDNATNNVVAKVEVPELKGQFGAFIGKLMKADNKTEMVETYMKSQKQFPIIEDGGLVHFVYRGQDKDVALRMGFSPETPLYNVPGTDLFFATKTMDTNGFWEYSFSIFGDPKLDSLNPLVIGSGPRASNELRMPGWEAPDYLGEPTGAKGRIEEVTFKSETRGDERKLRVYLPADYQQGDKRYPLTIFNQGDTALDVALLDRALDNLMGKSMAPMIVAFVPTSRDESIGEHSQAYADMMVKDLIPHLDATYRTDPTPATRAIMGNGLGSLAAVNTVTSSPQSFGKLATQSFVFLEATQEVARKKLTDADVSKLQVYVEISTNDYKFPNLDAEASSRELIKTMTEKGATVKQHTNAGAPGWGNWRGQYGRIFQWLAPSDNKSNM